MSDQTGIDEEEKDADPVIDTFNLLQEPMRSQTSLFKSNACGGLSMEHGPIHYMNSFDRPQAFPLKQNSSVLEVLSNTALLSAGPLVVNGPSSHQAFESDEFHSLATEKDEEKSITQLKTVQDIDTTGIWGFDVESSEGSLDNFDSANDLNWDPQREFMQFLWESHDDSPVEDQPKAVPPPISQRRRKRKMDMVVMVDPSEELFSDLSLKSTKDVFDEDEQTDPVPINKVRSLRKRSKPQSTTEKKTTQHPNGTVQAIKQLIKFNGPARNSREKSMGRMLTALKGSPSTDCCSEEEEPMFFTCTKCSITFKKKNHLHQHMRSHTDPPSQMNMPKPFICRECGQSFRHSNSLLRHMTIHQERREKLMEEIQGTNELSGLQCPQCDFATNCANTFVKHAKTHEKDKRYYQGTNELSSLQCPQCDFATNCANTFVKHAKTHEKDKRYYDCEKCNFRAVSVFELERHMNTEHSVCEDQGEPDKLSTPDEHDDTPTFFSCNICSYSTSSKNVFKNHVELRHHLTYEEYEALQDRERNENAQPSSEQHLPISKAPTVDSFSSELTSKFSIEKQALIRERIDLPCDSNDISDLFKKDKIVNRARRGFKSQSTESKLDKSINNLLSRQRRDKNIDESPQKNEKIDVTTGFSFVENANVDTNNGFGGNPNSFSNGHKQLVAPKLKKIIFNTGCDASLSEDISADLNSKAVSRHRLEQPVVKKSPSKRKMSTPYRNTVDQDSCFILPKHLQSPIRQNIVEETDDSDDNDTFQYSDYSKLLDKSEIKQEDPSIGDAFSRRLSTRGTLRTYEILLKKGEDLDTGRHAQQTPGVKEECIETEVFGVTDESNSVPLSESFTNADSAALDMERKTCPYCPALFESGVGLSNHVRGHLHRVGLSYNARHVVSPEQVASQDRRPRIRRKMAAIRRLKKAQRFESQSTHSCPLCGDCFDNKTGLSNHVRGHLKRLGKTISTKNKSPLCLLRELMRDKKEFQRALQILGRKRFPSQPRISSKQTGADCLIPDSIPKRNPIQNLNNDAKPLVPRFSLSGEASDKKQQAETKLEVKGSLSSALIGILKKRKCQEDSKFKTSSQTTRNTMAIHPANEHSTGSQVTTTLPNSTHTTSEKGEFNRKVCVHCNASFHSGVSLSNHLRAYTKRKRVALLEGTTYDCKQRRQRSRPGSKKKMSPTLPHTPEEMYRLTCRFCDLVFQGPLSVQEDWIKHLQRHIMNASVPHTGAGMVEVTSFPKDLPHTTTDQQNPQLATKTAS